MDMFQAVRLFCLAMPMIAAVIFPNSILAQVAIPIGDPSSKYALSIAELDHKFQEHLNRVQGLIAERQDTLNRLAETKKQVANILNATELSSLQQLQTELAASAVQAETDQLIISRQQSTAKSGALNSIGNRRLPRIGISTEFVKSFSSMAKQTSDLKVQSDMLSHQIKTLKIANNLALDRFRSQLIELQKASKEMLDWNVKYVAMFDRYWELADVAGVRSDLELQAASTQLEKSLDDNPGAVFLKAVTCARLEQFDDATELLERLAPLKELEMVVLAMRAEILTRSGKKKDAAATLRKTASRGLGDPRVRMHRAVAFAASGLLNQAETEWEALLKLGGHSLACRRGLALIQGSMPSPSNRIKSKALENAELAMQLGGEDWSCDIAMAIATAANGKTEKAIEAATQASQNAVGNNQEFCKSILKKLENGEPIAWRF